MGPNQWPSAIAKAEQSGDFTIRTKKSTRPPQSAGTTKAQSTEDRRSTRPFPRAEPVVSRGETWKASILYRAASVLLLLFAALHTYGFRQVDPNWRVEPLITSMRSIHFDLIGSSRTYWDLFVFDLFDYRGVASGEADLRPGVLFGDMLSEPCVKAASHMRIRIGRAAAVIPGSRLVLPI